MKKNLQIVNLGSGSSAEDHFLASHLEAGEWSEGACFSGPSCLNGEIIPLRQETPAGGIRRVLKIGEDARPGTNPELETILFVVSNRTRWVSHARRPVEKFGRPGGEYGCIALLPPGVEPLLLPLREARRMRKSHWWVGHAYGEAVLLPRGVRLARIPWKKADAQARECRAFAEALGVWPVDVRRCTQEELLKQTEFLNGGAGVLLERASHGVLEEENPRMAGNSVVWERRLPEGTRWVLLKGARLNHPSEGGWRVEYAIIALDDVTPQEVEGGGAS